MFCGGLYEDEAGIVGIGNGVGLDSVSESAFFSDGGREVMFFEDSGEEEDGGEVGMGSRDSRESEGDFGLFEVVIL